MSLKFWAKLLATFSPNNHSKKQRSKTTDNSGALLTFLDCSLNTRASYLDIQGKAQVSMTTNGL